MKRHTPMKRSGFRPSAPRHTERDPDRQRATPTPVPGAFRAPAQVVAAAAPVPKEAPVRSEAYRRLVAQLPCKYCGIAGYSQCAHANTGKGAGIKASDLDSFPLCACRPGQRGCHSLFDSGALFSKANRRTYEIRWIAETQATLLRLAAVPKKLIPYMEHCDG